MYRLTQASPPNEQNLNFDYNGKGERVNKFGVGTARPSHYVYNESGAVAILKGAGLDRANSGVQNIIYIDQLPVGVLDNGLLLPIETDHLGTPRVVSDGNQAIWRWDLITGNASTGGSNAFGDRPANQDPDGNGKSYRFDLRFPGQIHDPETQLNYNYFRDYEPGTGRYVESDPIGLNGGVSTYGYVSQKPLTKTDFLGLAEICSNISFSSQHTFLCANGTCSGKYPSGNPYWFSPGFIVDDTVRKPAATTCGDIPTRNCDPVEFDRCIERTLRARGWSGDTYFFMTTNCGQWAEDTIVECWRKCGTHSD